VWLFVDCVWIVCGLCVVVWVCYLLFILSLRSNFFSLFVFKTDGKWTHVGVVMQKQPNDPTMTTVMLTVNGEILASKSMQRGKSQ
jgi:hypothetical protein